MTVKKDSFDSYSDKEEEEEPQQQQHPQAKDSIPANDSVCSGQRLRVHKPDTISIGSQESASSPSHRLAALERQLHIERQVRMGAENLLKMYASSSNQKLLQEAQNMLDYSNAKIQYLEMLIAQETTRKQLSGSAAQSPAPSPMIALKSQLPQFPPSMTGHPLRSTSGQMDLTSLDLKVDERKESIDFNNWPSDQLAAAAGLPNVEQQLSQADQVLNLEEIRSRLKLEMIFIDGLQNVQRVLRGRRPWSDADRAADEDAQSKLIESSQKVFLLRQSLKRQLDSMPDELLGERKEQLESDLSQSRKQAHLHSRASFNVGQYRPLSEDIIDRRPSISTSGSATNVAASLSNQLHPLQHSRTTANVEYTPSIQANDPEIDEMRPASLPRGAPLSGRLEIRLLGVKNLLSPSRLEPAAYGGRRRNSRHYTIGRKNSNVVGGADSGSAGMENKSSSKSKSACELKALLKLDNEKIGETTWRVVGPSCFASLGFLPVDLDRNRELELQLHYQGMERGLCAISYLPLEELLQRQQRECASQAIDCVESAASTLQRLSLNDSQQSYGNKQSNQAKDDKGTDHEIMLQLHPQGELR